MLEHGGRLNEAARRYGIPAADWLDLSTGINPIPWQGWQPGPKDWARLPEDDDGLSDAARHYYGAAHALPVAGSQAAIQALPILRMAYRVGVSANIPPFAKGGGGGIFTAPRLPPSLKSPPAPLLQRGERSDAAAGTSPFRAGGDARACRVAILSPGYAEHRHAWRRAGHAVVDLAAHEIEREMTRLDVVVIANPNNPDGRRFPPEILLAWRERLAARGGWLVVDEAFADPTPQFSLAAHAHLPGLVVLRSLGKFFGLAGARAGFVLGNAELLVELAELLGPWCIAGPARTLAAHALADRAWQDAARRRLDGDGERLARLLADHGLAPSGGCALFQWVETPDAAGIHDALARRGILARRFEQPHGLRFGLPGTGADWRRLEQALGSFSFDTRHPPLQKGGRGDLSVFTV